MIIILLLVISLMIFDYLSDLESYRKHKKGGNNL